MAKKKETATTGNCDSYFETVQSRKKLPKSLRESLTSAFSAIPVTSFPQVPGGKVIEISADTLIVDAVKVLSECNILSAPVTNPEASDSSDWRGRYLGIVDYSAIILWVFEAAELASVALSASSAAAAGVRAGAVGALGAVALGATGPAAVAGIAVTSVGAAVGGGMVADKWVGKDAATAASQLGDDFYKVVMQVVTQEPFRSTKVREIAKSFRSAPFLPVATDSTMLTILLLLSKYRMRNVPIIEEGKPYMKNFITQSAVIRGLDGCRGRDWFDVISAHPISDLGLPFMSPEQVVSIKSDEMILEAFKRLRDNKIGGLPVVEGSKRKIVGNLSIRDIRYLLLKPDLFANFRTLTVKDFVKTIATISQDMAKVASPIKCKSDSTLGDVIHTLASRLVHRIYVVAGTEDEIVGVVTLRDVISCFIYEPPNYFDSYFGFSIEKELGK